MARKRRHEPGIPERDELRSLESELRGIVIEERCSFGPELRSELAGEYQRLQREVRQSRSLLRQWGMAAAAVVLMCGSMLTVPSVRTSLATTLGIGRIPELREPTVPVTVLRAPGFAPNGRSIPTDPVAGVDEHEIVERSSLAATLPVLRNKNAARRVLADEIPPRLEEEEVGGTVRLLIWVSPEGVVELPQIDRSSGLPGFDLAAVRAIRSFRFEPATRLGVPVGMWVRFPIGFQPESTRVLLDEETEAFPGPWSN